MIALIYNFFFKCNSLLNNIDLQGSINVKGFVQIFNKGEISIGKNCTFNSGSRFNPIGGDTIMRLITRNNGKITIGNNVGISNSSLVSAKKITIGNNTIIGGSCKIWDTDFHSIYPLDRSLKPEKGINSQAIIIGENCFIGASSIILKGVTIGNNAVVAAGSIVTKDVDKNTIVAGSPAKLIKKI